MRYMQTALAMALPLILMAGCAGPEQAKTFATIMDTWPAVAEGHGRIVFFSPPFQPNIPQQQEGIGTRTNEANITLLSEGHTGRFNLIENSAGYIDVPAAEYAVNVRLAPIELSLTVEPQKTYYVKTQIRTDGFCENAELADSQQAQAIIRKNRLAGSAPGLPLTLIPRSGQPLVPASLISSESLAPGHCRLVLFRSSGLVGIIMPIHVGLDCPPHVKVRNKQYCIIDAPAGEHILTLSYSPNLSQGLADTYRVGLNVNLPADQTYNVGFFNVDDLSRIVPMTQSQADELMQKSSLIKDGVLKMVPKAEEDASM